MYLLINCIQVIEHEYCMEKEKKQIKEEEEEEDIKPYLRLARFRVGEH